VPFEQLFGWSGRWDDLPAAHAAAIAFDLLAMALLFLIGRRVRGPSLGVALTYAWAAFPFTLFLAREQLQRHARGRARAGGGAGGDVSIEARGRRRAAHSPRSPG